MDETLGCLQAWYLAQCDGDWEHSYGIRVSTLDNPGWRINVDLCRTPLETKNFEPVDERFRDEHDWIWCAVEDHKFKGYGGPANLVELFSVFLAWASPEAGG